MYIHCLNFLISLLNVSYDLQVPVLVDRAGGVRAGEGVYLRVAEVLGGAGAGRRPARGGGETLRLAPAVALLHRLPVRAVPPPAAAHAAGAGQ